MKSSFDLPSQKLHTYVRCPEGRGAPELHAFFASNRGVTFSTRQIGEGLHGSFGELLKRPFCEVMGHGSWEGARGLGSPPTRVMEAAVLGGLTNLVHLSRLWAVLQRYSGYIFRFSPETHQENVGAGANQGQEWIQHLCNRGERC